MLHHLDHLVLTTTDPQRCLDFYVRVLGMRAERFGPGGSRLALVFGAQKTDVHAKGREHEPKAHLPVPGALDLCFIAAVPLADAIERLRAADWPIVEGPVMRTGATGPIRSIDVRDPDPDLIEIAEPVEQAMPVARVTPATPATSTAPGAPVP